ncbi:MAG: DUF4290 domain-containing protein [Bacteroidales bacterium]|jgi:hypothetical protein|nr:DUF4290 domain-containing protein [Bacteroidales bacterium]
MEYNTEREKLFLPEHGRNIQKMIESITKIEDKDKRTKYIYGLVNVLYNLNDGDNKDGNYLRKLWDQIHIMSNYELNVDSPFPPPTPEEIYAKPNRILYNSNRIKFRHYGNLTQMLINKVVNLPEGEKKDRAIVMLATQMKKLYLIWNRESVDDKLIIEDMQAIAEGKLDINNKIKLPSTALLLSQEKNRVLKSIEPEPAKGKNKGKKKNAVINKNKKIKARR